MDSIDIAGHVGAITREVRRGERDGRPTIAVVASRTFETTVEDLWHAITDAERIPRWLLPITGDLRLGGRYQLEGNAGGQITACEPPHRFSVTWEFGGEVTWLDVRLSAAGADGTTLELEHTAHPGDHWGQFGPGAVGIGWDLSLLGLALHLTTAAGRDRPVDADWESSDEAKAFSRRSGEGWLAADLASGTPEEVARPASDRTIAAYTGAE